MEAVISVGRTGWKDCWDSKDKLTWLLLPSLQQGVRTYKDTYCSYLLELIN